MHELLEDPQVEPASNRNEAVRMASRFGRCSVLKLLLADPRVDPSAEEMIR